MKSHKLTTSQIALVMAVMTVASRLLGFMREMVLANYYGAGVVTDAYIMSQQIPGTLIAAVMTAFSTSFMPLLSERTEIEGTESADLFTSRMLNTLLLFSGAVIVGCIIFADPLVSLFAPGYDAEASELTARYLRIASLLIAGNGVYCIMEPYLQYKGHMLTPINVGFILNLVMIIFVVLSVYSNQMLLIWGVALAYILRGLAMFVKARRTGMGYSLDFRFSDDVKEVFALGLPIFIGTGISQINTFVDKMLASGLPTGSVSALNYGGLITNFIISISVTVVVTIVYPKLTQAFATENYDKIGQLTESGINLFALICIPFTFGAMVYADPAIQVIYERGAFEASATSYTATAFFWYSAGIVFIALNQLLTRVFYSMHDTKTAVYCSVAAVIANIVLNIILVKVMGIGGLALATSISQGINAAALYKTFKHKYPHITLLRSKRKLLKICIFSAISVGASYALYSFLSHSGGIAALPQILLLGIAILAAVIIYIALACIARFEEVDMLKDLIRK